jgi:hypothetical protein
LKNLFGEKGWRSFAGAQDDKIRSSEWLKKEGSE